MPQQEDNQNLNEEIERLKARLYELEESLSFISVGGIDALVVNTIEGDKVFTLKSAEQPYRIFIEEMNQGAIMLSENDTILYCNRAFAEMVKEGTEKIVGKKVQNYLLPLHVDAFNEMLEKNRIEKVKTEKTFTLQAQDGSHLSTQISASLLREENVNKTCLVVTDLTAHMQDEVRHYTEKLEYEVEARTRKLSDTQRLAAIGETAGMVGHDIRNPLQAIVSELYLAKEELECFPNTENKSALKVALESIEAQTFYINKIVADLQDYTKPLTPHPQPVNIEESIRQSLSSVVIPSNISMDIQVEKNAPKLEIDPLYIKRILVNLISNALQAMPNGGKLIINVKSQHNKVTISVEDTGFGIPENVKSQIFKPLFTTKAKGQGLGLAVVKRLVEASNGSVTFDSQVGKGAAFTIAIPFCTQENMPKQRL
jgi:PAS domain S-box-containing protein